MTVKQLHWLESVDVQAAPVVLPLCVHWTPLQQGWVVEQGWP